MIVTSGNEGDSTFQEHVEFALQALDWETSLAYLEGLKLPKVGR